MAALLLAFGTWGTELRGRRVRLFSDNTVAECCFRRGSAKVNLCLAALARAARGHRSQASDHNRLVHAFWREAWSLHCHVHLDRVDTDRNLSDLPSREDYSLLSALAAMRVQAAMPAI